MLESAAAVVEPGGTLVYSVCALTRQEGPEQVRAFLERHSGFREVPLGSETVGDLQTVKLDHGVAILPVDGLDGFFVARLQRA